LTTVRIDDVEANVLREQSDRAWRRRLAADEAARHLVAESQALHIGDAQVLNALTTFAPGAAWAICLGDRRRVADAEPSSG